MAESTERVRVVVLNSNDDLLRLLGEIGERAGFDVITAHTNEIGRDPTALQAFIERHDPKAILYDISPPYPDNWALFRQLYDAEQKRGTGRPFVVTTPNKEALEQHVGDTHAIELIGDRTDREAIAEAIRRAISV